MDESLLTDANFLLFVGDQSWVFLVYKTYLNPFVADLCLVLHALLDRFPLLLGIKRPAFPLGLPITRPVDRPHVEVQNGYHDSLDTIPYENFWHHCQ